MRTIRTRITAMAVGVFLLVLGLVAVLIVTVQRQTMMDTVDRGLTVAVADVRQRLADGSPIGTVVAESSSRLSADDVFVIVRQGDRIVARSANLNHHQLPPPPGGAGAGFDELRFETNDVIPVDDDTFRLVTTGASPDDADLQLTIGHNIDNVVDAMQALIVTLVVLVPTTSAMFGFVVWILIGRTLRPVERIRDQVEEIGPADLDRRVPTPDTGDEIDRLASTMNSMLDRIERSNISQRRFVGDASHELRLPLTRMRTNLEVELNGGDTQEAARTALQQTVEMQQLVDDLLLLARFDHRPTTDPPGYRFTPVDLDVIVDARVEASRELAPGSPRVEMSGVSAAVVAGSQRQLARLVDNLLTNAGRHARSMVRVALTETDDQVVLTVDDDGSGVPAEDRATIFDRFTRVDQARHAAHGGTGLGLAIVAEIARDHGGRVDCLDSPLGGARFQVRLPARSNGTVRPMSRSAATPS